MITRNLPSRGRSLIALLIALVALVGLRAEAQQAKQNDRRAYPPKLSGAEVEVYKRVDDIELNMYIFSPKGHKPSDRRAAIVFFFGGGWRAGSPAQFHQHCRLLAEQGMVAMAADYRVSSRHNTKARACVEDGKSAVRWIRQHADRLGVDPERVAAGGGSAGGHVAACTALIEAFDEAEEDATISSRPDALVLFNPAVVLAGWKDKPPFDSERMKTLEQRMGVPSQQLSPAHHVRKGLPPTIIFHGKADTTVPYWTVEVFAEAMKNAENRCELKGYEGEKHGFFNYGRGGNEAFQQTTREMLTFLASIDFLTP